MGTIFVSSIWISFIYHTTSFKRAEDPRSTDPHCSTSPAASLCLCTPYPRSASSSSRALWSCKQRRLLGRSVCFDGCPSSGTFTRRLASICRHPLRTSPQTQCDGGSHGRSRLQC